MINNKDDQEYKNSLAIENGRTKKTRPKLLANMIMKAKEKIKRHSSNNQTMAGGSVTCLYDIRNKSGTSQSSKSKMCEDSESHLEDNAQSGNNLQQEMGEIATTSKDSTIREPSLQASLQKNDTITANPKGSIHGGKNFNQNAYDCVSPLNKCSSMAFISAAVKEVLDFTQRLQSSEAHLLEILKKYLGGSRLEKELTDIITGHVTLQIKAERHAQNLANDMWLQQAQFYKNQEKVFNETIKEIMSQNRKLHEENELLSRKNERIYIKMALAYDNGSSCSHEQSNLYIIEQLGKNNEKLRYRNNQLVQQTRRLDTTLLESKEESSNVERQLQNCFCEIHNQKRAIQSLKLDNELEVAVLNRKVENTEKIFQDALHEGESVIEEITVVKHQLSSVLSMVNWKDLRRSI